MSEVQVLAERYFDNEIAPGLRASGTPEYPIEKLRERYVRDVHNNQIAIEELKEYYRG